jgi:hypothetical protein
LNSGAQISFTAWRTRPRENSCKKVFLMTYCFLPLEVREVGVLWASDSDLSLQNLVKRCRSVHLLLPVEIFELYFDVVVSDHRFLGLEKVADQLAVVEQFVEGHHLLRRVDIGVIAPQLDILINFQL